MSRTESLVIAATNTANEAASLVHDLDAKAPRKRDLAKAIKEAEYLVAVLRAIEEQRRLVG